MDERRTRPKTRGTARAGKPRASSPKAESREQASGIAASRLIDQRIRDLGGWRGETLARMRKLILEADPEMIEEWKWMGTPVWSHDGIVCTGETYKKVVKLTFARGASLEDPSGLFNSSLEGNTRRAIDIREGEKARRAGVQGADPGRGRGEPPAGAKTAPRPRRSGQAQAKPGRERGTAGRPPLGRQPADREGRRRRPGAGVHRRDAGLEERPREAPRRAHRAHRARRAQGREVELAVLRHRGPGLVPVVPRLHPLRQGDLLPRHVAATRSRPAARRRARTRAGSTSTRTTSSTRRRWRSG